MQSMENGTLAHVRQKNLRAADVARIVGCHRNTVLRYENRGLIQPERDYNGWRKYSIEDALALCGLLSPDKPPTALAEVIETIINESS